MSVEEMLDIQKEKSIEKRTSIIVSILEQKPEKF